MTTPNEAMRLALEALEQVRKRADSANGIGHLYEGDCPDPGQPDARDPGCPACRTIDESEAAIAALREAIERDGWQQVPGAVWHEGSVSLIRRGTEDDFCARRGAQRIYLPLHPAPKD